jgi:uncharacterized protein YecT (DUF1311 family)
MKTLLCALLLAALPLLADDTPATEDEALVCRSFAQWTPAGEAVITDADRKAMATDPFCIDYIYLLQGDVRDYARARRCCLAQGKCNRELAMIFANGWGVQRNYDTATAFLCRASPELADAELWGMLKHVREMRAGKEKDDLKYCDYVTSGHGMAFCAEVQAAAQARSSEARVGRLRARLQPHARMALAALVTAGDAFAQVEGKMAGESSRGGTMYSGLVIGAQSDTTRAILAEVERTTAHRAPAATPEARKSADAALNAAYAKALTCPNCGAEERAQWQSTLRDAQRAWLRYRDAFIAYYTERWKERATPNVLHREIETMLAKGRAEGLAGLE